MYITLKLNLYYIYIGPDLGTFYLCKQSKNKQKSLSHLLNFSYVINFQLRNNDAILIGKLNPYAMPITATSSCFFSEHIVSHSGECILAYAMPLHPLQLVCLLTLKSAGEMLLPPCIRHAIANCIHFNWFVYWPWKARDKCCCRRWNNHVCNTSRIKLARCF